MAHTTDTATVTVEVSPEAIDEAASRLAADGRDPTPRNARDHLLDVVDVDVELLDEGGRPVTEAVAREADEGARGS